MKQNPVVPFVPILTPIKPMYILTTASRLISYSCCHKCYIIYTLWLSLLIDLHIQRIVLATEETTATQQVSHRAPACGHKEVRRPTGHIIMVTIRYSDQQGSTWRQKLCDSTSNGTDQCQNGSQTSLLHIERNLDRLGLSSPTHDQRSQQQSKQITLQSVLINKSKFLKATHDITTNCYNNTW